MEALSSGAAVLLTSSFRVLRELTRDEKKDSPSTLLFFTVDYSPPLVCVDPWTEKGHAPSFIHGGCCQLFGQSCP